MRPQEGTACRQNFHLSEYAGWLLSQVCSDSEEVLMAGDYFSQFAIVVPNLFSSYSTAIFFSHAIAFLSWFSMLNINVFFMVLMLLFPILSVLIWHQKKKRCIAALDFC